MTQTTPPTNALPRPMSPAAARQSWRELPVRVWMLLTAGVLIVVLVVSGRNITQGLTDRELVTSGIPVEATIDLIYGAHAMVDRSDTRDLGISYKLPDEKERRVVEHTKLTPVYAAGEENESGRPKGTLLRPTMKFMNPGDRLPIRVDPKDPRRWTDRVNPASWLATLWVPLLLSPIVLLLVGMTVLQRKRHLATFQKGLAARATVVDLAKSALTPGARVVKLSIVGGDGRVLVATRPDRLGPPPTRGETVDVYIDRANKPRRVLLAHAYQ